ncbi:hypothetical protein HND97_00865 [Vibrio cholerae]|nr:hypothetical protein HND97_00865 [Vibrio cholerae]
MAAGLTIEEQNFARFCRLFDQLVREELDEAALKGLILSDGELKPEEFSLHTAELLRACGPWGQAFPEPCLMANLKCCTKTGRRKHFKLMLEPLYKGFPTDVMIDGIAFNVDLRRWPDASVKSVRLAYKLDINEFRGNQSLQLMIDHLEAK